MTDIPFEPTYSNMQSALQEHFQEPVRTQVALAAILTIRQSSISDAKRRNSFPTGWFVTLLFEHNINPWRIMTGKGQLYVEPTETLPDSPPVEPDITIFKTEELLGELSKRLPGMQVLLSGEAVLSE